jgi:hypothetical protein
MGSDALIYVPSFIKIGPGVQKLIGGDTQTHTHGQHRDLISLLCFFKIRKVRLKMDLVPGSALYLHSPMRLRDA